MNFNTVNYDPSDPDLYEASVREPQNNVDQMIATLLDESVNNYGFLIDETGFPTVRSVLLVTRIHYAITLGLGLALTAVITNYGGHKVRTVEALADSPSDVRAFLNHIWERPV